MTRYEAEPWLRDLTDFQRRSVNHVFEQFYGRANAQRFLVADETGLGKTRVAQGVIARSIEHLQDVDGIKRIDVVYVCANSDLAKQNIRRLNVTGQREIPFSSRLTLLGEHSRRLNQKRTGGKGVNLVSFTPGTSFDMGHSLGQARERAMIALALEQIFDMDGYQRRATRVLLQGTVASLENFQRQIDWLAYDLGEHGIDRAILREFRKLLKKGGRAGLGGRVLEILQGINRKAYIPQQLHGDALRLVRELRSTLAAASVHTLEPDLVILDEFQRFRHLLSPNNPAGELAHHLFEFDEAKVLLLSATPYKPFTYSEEDDENHARDLYRTLGFLALGRSDASVDEIRTGLERYREALVDGTASDEIVSDLRHELLKLMSRAERPRSAGSEMTVERLSTADDLRPADLADFARVSRIAAMVRSPRDHGLITPEYWKSAPYFLSFADGYQLGRRVRDAEVTDDLRRALKAAQLIDYTAVEGFQPLEPGNARMRVLSNDTVQRGWWQLLWMPPSLPYLEPEGPYASQEAQGITKRLVFSSWTATPASVASILSYEAERLMAEGTKYTSYSIDGRKSLRGHLRYRAGADGEAKDMSVLLCHFPLPQLATDVDPLAWVAANDGQPISSSSARAQARAKVRECLASSMKRREGSVVDESGSQESPWRAAFAVPGNWPDDTADVHIIAAIAGNRADESDSADDESPNGLAHHVIAARSALESGAEPPDDRTIEVLTEIALFSPANIAFRVLSRLARDSDGVTGTALFEGAATVANGLRSLFNRPDVIALMDRADDQAGTPYWWKVLHYNAMGNLEAVLDEYLHQLLADRTTGPATDILVLEISREAAEALGLRSATLRARDPLNPQQDLGFIARFALRYGGREQNAEDARQPEVRRAFNSPFWPFVLASTSVGQEGIDFHWWCHAIFHWNTPSNPVDFEQREGRVDRYRGHAVRKNVAAKHGRKALSSALGSPWDRLYKLASNPDGPYGDFSPGWVYPGPARIERHVALFAFSTDLDRYDRMKRDVALYRLTFGQPRQEDMLDLLRRRGVDADPALLESFRIDLAP